MPLTAFNLGMNTGWTFQKTQAPFQPVTSGPDALSFNLGKTLDLTVFTEALVASVTLAAGASQDYNLNSFTDILGTAVTATKALSFLVITSGPSSAVCQLTASAVNALNWFLSCPGSVTGGVAGTASATGLIRVQVASTTNLSTGMRVAIKGVTGTTEANGVWTITVIDSTHFDLQGSTFANAYSAGGTIALAPAVLIPAGGTFLFSLGSAMTPQVLSASVNSMRFTNSGTGSLVVEVVALVGP